MTAEPWAGIGDRISEVATRVGGKRALAKAAGVTEDQIHRYCRGANLPGIDVVVRIAAAGGVSVEWLATGRAEPAEVMPTHTIKREVFVRWLRQWWDDASDRERTWMDVELERRFPEYGEWKKTMDQPSAKRSGA